MPFITPFNFDEAMPENARPQSAADAALGVKFYTKPTLNKKLSEAEGRAVFEDKEYVEIRVNKDEVVHEIVTDAQRNRFPRHYEAFRRGKDQATASGTVLTAWGALSEARCEEYAAGGVRTVEQLAAIADSRLREFGPITRQEQERAKDFVAAMKGAAPINKLRSELEARDNEIQTLKRTVEEMKEAVARLQETKAKKSKEEKAA